MTKVILNCDLECDGVMKRAGETIEVDADNLARLLRKNAVRVPEPPASKKKKKKAAPDSE